VRNPELAGGSTNADVMRFANRVARFTAPHAGTVVFLAGLVVVVGLRFSQLSVAEAPPGADGGDWLAFAYQLFGQHVRAADAASPPIVPLVIGVLMTVLSPLVALKIVAVLASVAVAVPFYIIVRREVPPIAAGLLAVVATMAGYHSETMAWGGYPQLLGVAFLVATLLTLAEGLLKRSQPLLVVSAVCAALTLGTHQLAATTLVLAAPICVVCLAVQIRPAIRALILWRSYLVLWFAYAAIFSLPILPFYLKIVTLARGNPANPQGYGLTSLDSAFSYAFRDEPLLWAFLTVGGAAFCFTAIFRRKGSPLAASAAALLLASFLIFAALGEVRALQILQVGVLESVALSVAALFKAADASSPRDAVRLGWRVAVGVAMVGLVATLAIRGNDRGLITMDYYRVVDGPALEALGWLGQHTPPGSLVVAGQTPRDGPYSWWAEGISKRPSYSINLKFLHGYNKEEQDQILYATRVLSPSTSAADASRLIRQRKIQFFFVDKRASDAFSYLIASVPMRVVFQNREIEILAPVAS
jgi:hypothetical protein